MGYRDRDGMDSDWVAPTNPDYYRIQMHKARVALYRRMIREVRLNLEYLDGWQDQEQGDRGYQFARNYKRYENLLVRLQNKLDDNLRAVGVHVKPYERIYPEPDTRLPGRV